MPRRPPPHTPAPRYGGGLTQSDIERVLIVADAVAHHLEADHDVVHREHQRGPHETSWLLVMRDERRLLIVFERPAGWDDPSRLPNGRRVSKRERVQLICGAQWWYEIEVHRRRQVELSRDPLVDFFGMMLDIPARMDRDQWKAYAQLIVSRALRDVRRVLAPVRGRVKVLS